MNSVTESFNTTMTQMTETSQKKMTDMSEQKKTKHCNTLNITISLQART